MMSAVLDFQNVAKSFGRNKVIQQVSFPIQVGETVALLGPNGAGKSTLLSLAFGLRKPDAGRVLLFGQDPCVKAARQKLGVTPQNTSFPPFLKLREVLNFVAQLYGTGQDVDAMIEVFQLQKSSRKMVGALSEGQKRRLALACAFVGRPELVLLDEPTTGLDIESRAQFFTFLRHLRERRPVSILFSTHHLEEVEAIAGRVLVLHRGRLQDAGTFTEIKHRLRLKKISYEGELPTPPEGWAESVVRVGEIVEIWTQLPDEWVRWMVETKVRFANLKVEEASLEQIFFRLLENLNNAPDA